MKVILETDRLFLREMKEDDHDALYQVLSDSEIMQHYPYIFDESRVKEWIERNMNRFSCTFMPITGVFAKMSSGGDGIGGRLALVVWCVYFLPIGILSFHHFNFRKDEM